MVVRAGCAIFLNVEVATGGSQMLVITRREGEEVVIGDPANPLGVIRIATIKGDRVRIALDFPREIAVHRREIAAEIAKNGPAIAGKIRPASKE
jgi:carbon storage regulator